jgi:hypothetical protein
MSVMTKKASMSRFIVILIVGLLTYACTNTPEQNAKNLPAATGKSGDILILMDSTQWKSELGETVRNIFSPEVDGLPRSEPMFKVIWVHPSNKIRLLTQIRNLVYIFALDQASSGTRSITDNLSEETINNIKTDSSFYLVNTKNEYARGQEVMYLFGNTTPELIHHLKRDGQRIQDFFNNAEKQRMMASITKTSSTKNHTALLEKEYNISLHFPSGFQLAQKEKDFVWFRSPETEIDKNFFIARKPYESEYQLLPDSLLAWREKICMRYIFEDPDMPQSFITTERSIPFNPIKARQVNFNESFGMEIRGLWRTNNKTMGGPFISYSFVNEADNHIYYMEGFVYSPGKPQRELIREMQAIAYTFKIAVANTASKK